MNIPYQSVSRADSAGYEPAALQRIIRDTQAPFLINAAGYTGKPNVDACEHHKAECLEGNAVLPGKVAAACRKAGIPWAHVSSGCIYTGRAPDGRGFMERDEPNFSFRSGICSFYSGSKALGEEILHDVPNCYVWRLRIPFDHADNPRNYLRKLCSYPRLLDVENSLSHLEDFTEASLRCWKLGAPYGVYNLTNPGSVSTREVVGILRRRLFTDRTFHFFDSEDEFMREAAVAPRSNCVLDTSKAEAAGFGLRPIADALADAIANWESPTVQMIS